ncbi:MAG: T9SS type A sorting domain-containing protein [Flavobacteriales bacterium]|nr:T9SS type A sorting domain-containing protein [Flavobacteriales bacterium]
MNKSRVLFLVFIFSFTFAFSQEEVIYEEHSHVKTRCGFNHTNKDITKKSLEEFSTEVKKYTARKKSLKISDEGILILPVVVHVIHNGDAVGQNENITEARVQSQITVLNQDYRRMFDTNGFNTNPVGADVEIQFQLVTTDPNGNPTNGIDRVNYGLEDFKTFSEIDKMKEATIWDPNNYINIWTVNVTDTQTEEFHGYLGIAQFPVMSDLGGIENENNPAETDGVLIDWKAFGSSDLAGGEYYVSYDKGRTTTHEMGHFLGLLHVFQGEFCGGSGDYCDDTPVQSTSSNSCLLAKDSCPSLPGVDMVENYMDYTYDSCMNVFTQDQKDRIWTVLDVSPRRKSLKNTNAFDQIIPEEDITIEFHDSNSNTEQVVIYIKNVNDARVTIYSIYGELVYDKKIVPLRTTIDTSYFDSGIYIINVEAGKNTKILKFIR